MDRMEPVEIIEKTENWEIWILFVERKRNEEGRHMEIYSRSECYTCFGQFLASNKVKKVGYIP